jgi:hypothetical protein
VAKPRHRDSDAIVGRRAGGAARHRFHPTNTVGEPALSKPRAGRAVNPYCLTVSERFGDSGGLTADVGPLLLTDIVVNLNREASPYNRSAPPFLGPEIQYSSPVSNS